MVDEKPISLDDYAEREGLPAGDALHLAYQSGYLVEAVDCGLYGGELAEEAAHALLVGQGARFIRVEAP